MNTLFVVAVPVGGIVFVVLLVWALGWNEQDRLASMEEARRLLEAEGRDELDPDDAVIGDEGLTALFFDGGRIVAIHVVGTRRNVVDCSDDAVAEVVAEGDDLRIETSRFGYPTISIVLRDSTIRQRWLERFRAVE